MSVSVRPTIEAAPPILAIEGVGVCFAGADGPVPALRDVSLSLRDGEVLGIVGESGSGKSTLLSAILRMLPAGATFTARRLDYGDVDLMSCTPKQLREIRGREIALIPQRPLTSLSPVASIQKQVSWQLDGVDRAELLAALDAEPTEDIYEVLLRRVGLGGVADRRKDYPHQFSGGQLQRLLTAVAVLAKGPRVLLADEPTTTLDVTVQAQVMSLLLSLRDRLGLSIVLVTHDLGIVAQACDRVVVMYAGEVMEVADTVDLFTAPRHPYTRALLDALPSRHERGDLPVPIPGSSWRANQLGGCPFHTRCPFAIDICAVEPAPVKTVGRSESRCHRAEEMVLL